MSNIAIKGATTGTGTFTIESPATNTDRTLTLPDEAGTVLTSGGAIDVDASAPADSVSINASGNLGVGTTSPDSIGHFKNASGNATLKVEGGTTAGNDAYTNIEIGNTTGTSGVFFSDTTNGVGRITYEHSGDYMRFYVNSAEKARFNDGTGLLIGTTNNSPAESSTATGIRLGYSGGAQFSKSGTEVAIFNRNTNDGVIMEFRQAGTQEGTISVSGTTVSYNGGHLARWSQLADNTRDDSIVKGTVMSNLNQMAEWTTDGVTEDNEQLNCMKVSDTEGDANVAGVFVNWDNDDDIYTNDMNVAMTGDFVIRIAQGTTVARGDLLMSAGDGTAKPQGDDIVRSKTIAKVTSTHVSHTYDDGSYLVPCVLMAC